MDAPNAPAVIATERLILRRPTRADGAAIHEYAGDPEVTRLMNWRTHAHPQEATAFLERAESRWRTGEEYTWVVTVKPDDRAIGGISVRVRGSAADFGYVLNRRFWGCGYATEAARAVVAWAMHDAGVCRVWATCDAENVASARVLEKVGLRCEGTLPAAIVRPNLSPAPRDALIFALTRDPEGTA
jgi:RimJ/RimL family protein N-acetyltransferase